MARTPVNEEIRILRFFEDAPIEKAELLFNIITEKMRLRMAPNAGSDVGLARKRGRRPVRIETEMPTEGET